MTPEKKQPSVFDQLWNTSLHNLTLYCDKRELLQIIDPNSIDDLFTAYYQAHCRLEQGLFGHTPRTYSLSSFPPASIVLTQNEAVFRGLYPNPTAYEKLPQWVSAYVNFGQGCYVHRIPENGQLNINVDGSSHEFTHVFTPEVFCIPRGFAAGFFPTWAKEALAVGLNQLQPPEWLIAELKKPGITIPSIQVIKDNGLFFIDNRPPNINTAYQYCCHYMDFLGRAVQQCLFPEFLDCPPQSTLGLAANLAYKQSIPTLDQLLSEYHIDPNHAET